MYSKLNQTERELLAQWKKEGVSNKECARRLARHHTTIGRELQRNKYQKTTYEPLHAQAKTDTRKEKAWQAKTPIQKQRCLCLCIREAKRRVESRTNCRQT